MALAPPSRSAARLAILVLAAATPEAGAAVTVTQYTDASCSTEIGSAIPFGSCSCVRSQGLDGVSRGEMFVPHANGTLTKLFFNETDCSGCKICQETFRNGVCYLHNVMSNKMFTWDNAADTGCTTPQVSASACPGVVPACTCGEFVESGGETPSSTCSPNGNGGGNPTGGNTGGGTCQNTAGSATGSFATYTQFRSSPCCAGSETSGGEMGFTPCGCSSTTNSSGTWGQRIVLTSATSGHIEYYSNADCTGCKVCETAISNNVCFQKPSWSDMKYRWSADQVCTSSASFCVGAEGTECEAGWAAVTTTTTPPLTTSTVVSTASTASRAPALSALLTAAVIALFALPLPLSA